MWKRLVIAWGLYRHGVALKGLLQSLGLWGYVATVGASVMGAIVALSISLPIWGQILVGLGTLSLILFCVGFAAALWRAGADPKLATSLPAGVPPAEVATPVGDKSVIRSPLEQGAFAALYSEFMCLSWAQKVALKVLCIRVVTHEITLSMELEQLGFGAARDVLYRIVNPLHECSLVEFKPEGALTINPARIRDVEELVNGWHFEF